MIGLGTRLLPRRRLPDRIRLEDPAVTVALRVSTRARRFTLRLDPAGDGAVLTMPPGVALAHVEAFLQEHAGWLAHALARQPERVRISPGARVPVDGVDQLLLSGDHRGAPRLSECGLVLPAGRAPGRAVQAWLKERARARMVPAVERYAAQLGRPVAAVSLRDTRSRWGSCTSAGRISLSWRLAMAPVAVQDYVAAHEVAHLQEMNHSPRYWRCLAGLMPDYQRHRAWLRREGRHLHAYDFDSAG
ncbi:MAG: M48 family metallopeptidase [Pseudomonadota bacterium]